MQRLYPTVRPEAGYQQSLELLRQARPSPQTRPPNAASWVGLGETGEELTGLLADLRQTGCDILTIGQYLQPSKSHLAVERYLPPEEFTALEREALALGFAAVASAPFVRSSYQAEALFQAGSRKPPHRNRPFAKGCCITIARHCATLLRGC